jgi:dGTPase
LLIDRLVTDLIRTLSQRLEAERITSYAAVREYGRPLVGFSAEVEEQRQELKRFLMDNLYRHYLVNRMMVKAQRVVADLFHAYRSEPALLPPHILQRRDREGETLERIICDYIAGMTDRFALQEHRKLFDPEERV